MENQKNTGKGKLGGVAVRFDQAHRERLVVPRLVKSITSCSCLSAVAGTDEFFVGKDGESFLPYYQKGRLSLALAEPIVSPPKLARKMLEEYLWYCKRRGVVCGIFPCSNYLAHSLNEIGFGCIHYGVETQVNLTKFSLQNSTSRNLRKSVRKAEKSDVKFYIVRGDQSDFDAYIHAIREVEKNWKQWRKPYAFVFGSDPLFAYRHRRYGLAFSNNKLVGFCSLFPMGQINGWCIDVLARLESACSGTADFLVARVAEELRDEGFETLSLGLTLVTSPQANTDADFPLASQLLDWISLSPVFPNRPREQFQFKRRFVPAQHHQRFFCFHPARMSLDLFISFLGILFPGFDVKEWIYELWREIPLNLRKYWKDTEVE